MAKKKVGKVIQMLSPENYIRKKARSLPIYECLVNTDWKEQGVAHVIVARNHTNGNITVCMYLVDLFCLGIKNTQYLFNIPESEYQDKKEEFEHIVLESISYELAHNIVFAGLEFAEEYEFKPHKDFTSITQYLLEEDTDDIELIDIECGREGKPFFVNGPYDDVAKIKQIIAQLNRTAGPGNFDVEIVDEDDEFVGEDEFELMSIEDQRHLFERLYDRRDDLNDYEDEQLRRLTEYEVTNDVFTEEMLGITNKKLSPGTCELFTQVYEMASDDPEAAKILLNDFRNETPENPASLFLELIILRAEEAPEYEEKVQEYYARFPEYSLIKMLQSSFVFAGFSTDAEETIKEFTMQSLFAGRTWIHHLEAYNYLISLLMGLTRNSDIDRIQGLYDAYNTLDLTEDEFAVLDEFIFIVKSTIVEQVLLSE